MERITNQQITAIKTNSPDGERSKSHRSKKNPVRSRRGSCAPTDRPKDMPKSAKTGRRTEVATSNRPVGAEQQLQERKRTEPRRERGRHQTGNAVRRVKVIVLHEVSPSRGGVPDRTVSRRVLMIMLRSAVSAYRGSASRVQKEVTIPLQRARPGRASRLPRTRNRFPSTTDSWSPPNHDRRTSRSKAASDRNLEVPPANPDR